MILILYLKIFIILSKQLRTLSRKLHKQIGKHYQVLLVISNYNQLTNVTGGLRCQDLKNIKIAKKMYITALIVG